MGEIRWEPRKGRHELWAMETRVHGVVEPEPDGRWSGTVFGIPGTPSTVCDSLPKAKAWVEGQIRQAAAEVLCSLPADAEIAKRVTGVADVRTYCDDVPEVSLSVEVDTDAEGVALASMLLSVVEAWRGREG